MSMEDAFKQFNSILQQIMPFMIFALAIAIIVSAVSVKGYKKYARPKSAAEAVKEVLSHEGWVLVTVDEERCGYCGLAKVMLEARGIRYKEVNITDVPEEELDEIVNTLGIEHVPVLLFVKDGRIVLRKHFEGVKEKDVKWVRRLEVEA